MKIILDESTLVGQGKALRVNLTASEIYMAADVGSRRNAEAIANGRKKRFPESRPGELWASHIESAGAELAVSKALGLFWGGGVNTFHVADIVNTNYEIRWSNRNDCKVRPDDTGIVISVSGACPEYIINGWCYAEDAKKQEYKCNREPVCYFIPKGKLKGFIEK